MLMKFLVLSSIISFATLLIVLRIRAAKRPKVERDLAAFSKTLRARPLGNTANI